jgi:hypothetical protein
VKGNKYNEGDVKGRQLKLKDNKVMKKEMEKILRHDNTRH